jgi:pimeloyl-ACP methyl ester carboxylesterase
MRTLILSLILILAPACAHPRPIGYTIEPGVSVSFPPSERATTERYTEMFCRVLEKEFAADWRTCNEYVLMKGLPAPQPWEDIPPGWTLLRIGGFGAQCVATTAEAFEDAGKHLNRVHGLADYHIPVGALDTSEHNARLIRDFIMKLGGGRFIVVAHSKGAADMMTALTLYPGDLENVKAFITVAGAIGGSHLVDDLDKLNRRLTDVLDLKDCTLPPSPNAVDSMQRTNRQKFLADHEVIKTPSFSISAVSTRDSTSKILQVLWDKVAPHALEQDSHIIEREAIVPGGGFLGRALGDHWAVAFPFDPNPKVKKSKWIDKNKFPREALIEAAVRVAIKSVQ